MQPLPYTSNKPYLFRAILDWLLDNDATPHILVDAKVVGVEVPQEHIKDGQIVLNINPSAVQNWLADNDAISFNARFAGQPRSIYVPMAALLAVYAQENGQGMAFPPAEDELEGENDSSQANIKDESSFEAPRSNHNSKSESKLSSESKASESKPAKKGSHLKLIK